MYIETNTSYRGDSIFASQASISYWGKFRGGFLELVIADNKVSTVRLRATRYSAVIWAGFSSCYVKYVQYLKKKLVFCKTMRRRM